MGYPQPSSNAYAVKGYQFFRLNTLLATPGDIYESEQGGLAVALGPDSDIARVQVSYFDDQAPDFFNQVTISNDRSFVGRIDANLDGTYTPANRPARILIAPLDLWNPQFEPPNTVFHTGDTHLLITPRLDVIEYLSEPPAGLVPQRSDKVFSFPEVPIVDPFVTPPTVPQAFITVPYYGRKFGNYKVALAGDEDALARFELTVWGITLQTTTTSSISLAYTTNFIAGGGGSITAQTKYEGSIKALVNPADANNLGGGMYDFVMFQIKSTVVAHPIAKPFFFEFTTSDTPAG